MAALLVAAAATAGCEPNVEAHNDAIYLSESPAPVDDGNQLSQYVAQCEAVLGEIPEISCDPANPAPGTHVTRIPVFVDGYLLGFGGEEDDAMLAARAANDDYVCDFPSIGGDFPCSVGSTLVQYRSEENPNVQWVGLCRGASGDHPDYNRFIGNGLIGANSVTGEMCFFFGGNENPDKPYELPKLTSDVESEDELSPWLPPTEMPGSCLSCHPNNDPWVMTPWLQPSYMAQVLTHEDYPLRLPEGVGLDEVFAARFVQQTDVRMKSMLPEPLPEGRTAWTEEEIIGEDGRVLRRQYRAVGSSYVANEAAGTVKNRSGIKDPAWEINFRDRLRLHSPETNCAQGCHATANAHFERMGLDSLGEKFAAPYLSETMRDPEAPGWAWMPPGAGEASHWLDAFEQGDASIPAITECPIPKRVEDEVSVAARCGRSSEGAAETVVELAWTYVNDYGGVPGRDDVRFDVALTIDPGSDFLGRLDDSPEGVRMEAITDDVVLVRDVGPSEPGGSSYRLEVALEGAGVVRAEVQPKRYCFEEPDRRPFAYAQPTVVEASAGCEP